MYSSTKYPFVAVYCIHFTHTCFTLLTVGHSSFNLSLYFYYIHSRSIGHYLFTQLSQLYMKSRQTRQDKQNKMMMVVGRSTILLGLCLMMLTPIGATRLPQYGLESIDGFCEGWGELDQLGDISSQVLNAKYPYMGPIRVS